MAAPRLSPLGRRVLAVLDPVEIDVETLCQRISARELRTPRPKPGSVARALWTLERHGVVDWTPSGKNEGTWEDEWWRITRAGALLIAELKRAGCPL